MTAKCECWHVGDRRLPVTASGHRTLSRSQNSAGGVTAEGSSPSGAPSPQGRTGLQMFLEDCAES